MKRIMDPIICGSCKNLVDPKSGACPVCGHEFTLKEIIPDEEVVEYKKKTISLYRNSSIILGLIAIGTFVLGGFWYIITAIVAVPLLIFESEYSRLSSKDLEEWRVLLSKTWKYRSNLERAGIILKILTRV